MLNYRVMMEPIGTNVFFMAPFGDNIVGNYHSLTQDLAGSVFTDEPIGIYMARSNVTEVKPELLRQASGDFPAQIALNYLQLPKLDGLGVTRNLRRHPKFRKTPIIIVSGHDPAKHRQPAIEAGCTDYLLKPIDFDRLDAILSTIVPLTR